MSRQRFDIPTSNNNLLHNTYNKVRKNVRYVACFFVCRASSLKPLKISTTTAETFYILINNMQLNIGNCKLNIKNHIISADNTSFLRV